MKKYFVFLLALVVGVSLSGSTAQAHHAWENYHWARTQNPFTVTLSNNLSPEWKPYLKTASIDWSLSSVLNTKIIKGSKKPLACKPTKGVVEVCNAQYGETGWMGLTQLWVKGDHITKATSKINDTYFAMDIYNIPEDRRHVMCHEIGHSLGLWHQDESGASVGSCMDYSHDAASQHPNKHDYDVLQEIYSHLDKKTTLAPLLTGGFEIEDMSDLNKKQNLGTRILRDGDHTEVYEKQNIDGTRLISVIDLVH